MGPGPVNANLGPGLVSTNWGTGLLNTNWEPGSLNATWVPGPVNTNWEPELGAGAAGGGRELSKGPGQGNTKSLSFTSMTQGSCRFLFGVK